VTLGRIARERVVSRPLRLLVRDDASTQSIRSSVERVGENQSKLDWESSPNCRELVQPCRYQGSDEHEGTRLLSQLDQFKGDSITTGKVSHAAGR